MKRQQQLTVVGIAATLTLMACPPSGVVCSSGTQPCGFGCIDSTADRRNCGQCGNACLAQQDCNSGTCECRAGTVRCADGACVVTDYDNRNCGQCGTACGEQQVCEKGSCQDECSAGFLKCGASCVEASTDVANCGSCGVSCAQGQHCKAGICDYEVVAACYWSGQVVGFDPATGVKGPLSSVGSNPSALARMGNTLLCADGMDRRLYSATPSSTGEYVQGALAVQTGLVPNQILVDRPYVYIVNAGSGSLLVLKEGSDGGVIHLDGGTGDALSLGAVAELPLGMNTFPQGIAKLGNALWVPLYGGTSAQTAEAGQEVLKIDITDPTLPAVTGHVSLKGIDLKPFDGGTPVARPFAITARQGALYVALNNMNADSYIVEGPGLVARIEPEQGTVTVIDLGAADCLNPQWLASVGENLAVSCMGKITPPLGITEAVEGGGVVVLDAQDARLPLAWNANTPCDAGNCALMIPGRFAVSGQQLLVGDQSRGRVVILEVTSEGLKEIRGLSSAIEACPLQATSGVANVYDLIAH